MKKLTLLIFLLSITSFVFGQDFTENTTQIVTKSGIGLGSVIAVVTSWDRNKSILWAIFHGICSWFYVIYFAITR
ncbi:MULTISPECIES: hypothetical protein [Sphingobacterium]|uniref:Uncharacterized protein n=2 Tax=Sphingobacterium TaxID=28453 RepID=A0ABW5YWQ7_9SPHI|nr:MULTISPECIES: hypothetical protein [Sphingobacterium]MCS3554113.1 hypothetical protein [Sphingobacterium sp. JUb21]MCW2263259.1 hypothetical protein [Sphingobacterium kitahiroshimense]NJI74160.1 hypothetical protein [Sphingobacterium sp. B16(2022)]TCR07946.1 hypothetical protein EDF66_10451 [Sphingobacterium sp. JUb20]TCR11757.1 hypothetical protein EDF67_103170 [Sphingobacterium sp. JUb78]